VVGAASSGSLVTLCGKQQLFGGFEVFGRGVFLSKSFEAPAHNTLGIRFSFWMIDSWSGESLKVLVDDKPVYVASFKQGLGAGENLCGGKDRD
jgi:hypothetical protein